jgi:hypothetical protein
MPPADSRPMNRTLRTQLDRLLYSENAWTALCLAIAAVEAYVGRHAVQADALSYVDMAQQTLRVGMSALANGVWSPGYPAMIALTFGIVHPAAAREFPVVHALNFAMFAATLWIWRAVLGNWTAGAPQRGRAAADQPDRSPLVPIGFGFFLLIVVTGAPPSLSSPDVGVLGLTLLIVLCYQRLSSSGRWAAALALGVACGLGYWMKAVLLPMAAALLLLLFVFPPRIPRARPKIVAAGAVWLAMSLALMAFLSVNLGHRTFGEAGRYNYARNVLKTGDIQSAAPYDAALAHPPRVLLTSPRVIEFASPLPGTFPLFYDPSYWNQGTPIHFSAAPQMHAIFVSVFEWLREWLFEYEIVLAALVGLAAVSCMPSDRAQWPRSIGVLFAWSLLWFPLYGVIHVESRYMIAAYLILSVLLARRLVSTARPHATLGIAAMVAGFVLIQAGGLAWEAIRQARDATTPEYLSLADGLRKLGLTPSTRIAVIGRRDGLYASYAHAARLQVAAEVIDEPGAPPVTDANIDSVKAVLARAGVRAIVRRAGPLGFASQQWHRVVLDDGAIAGVLFTTP